MLKTISFKQARKAKSKKDAASKSAPSTAVKGSVKSKEFVDEDSDSSDSDGGDGTRDGTRDKSTGSPQRKRKVCEDWEVKEVMNSYFDCSVLKWRRVCSLTGNRNQLFYWFKNYELLNKSIQ